MDHFEHNLLGRIDSEGLFEGCRRVLLAVSGGADSVVMAVALSRLRNQGRLGCELVMGHIEHGLRGAESLADAAFVADLGRRLGLPVVMRPAAVREYARGQRLSIETAGRVLRLRALAEMAAEQECAAVATAHHADDQAETLVHRLLRGTGFRGLCGIRPVSGVYGGRFVRPMLGIRRRDILNYARGQGLTWREDATNRDMTFTRNRIRRRLLPELGGDHEGLTERLCRLADRCRGFVSGCEHRAAAVLAAGRLDTRQGMFEIGRDAVSDCPPWIFYEVMRGVLFELGVGLRRYGREHFDAMQRLLTTTGGRATFPGGVEIRIDRDRVQIRKKQPRPQLPEACRLSIGQRVRFGPWTVSATLLDGSAADVGRFLATKDRYVEWLDADAICGELVIRPRCEGDRFWPIGAASDKKVGRFLMDGGFDAATRQQAFIVADGEKILWLVPLRMSEAAKVTPETKQILEIRVRGRSICPV